MLKKYKNKILFSIAIIYCFCFISIASIFEIEEPFSPLIFFFCIVYISYCLVIKLLLLIKNIQSFVIQIMQNERGKQLSQKIGKPYYGPKLHITIDFSIFPPIKIQNHRNFIKEKEKAIDKISIKQNYENYIREVFQTIRWCDFVIFNSHKLEFIQFWTGNGGFWLDFPIGNSNGNQINLPKLIYLLNKLGFSKRKRKDKGLCYLEYSFMKRDNFLLLNAHFGKNRELALSFTHAVLKNIFKTPLNKVEIMIG